MTTETPAMELTDADEQVWAIALILARYAYGEDQWKQFDPEERNH